MWRTDLAAGQTTSTADEAGFTAGPAKLAVNPTELATIHQPCPRWAIAPAPPAEKTAGPSHG